ncbi:MAG: hypothetical protein M3Y56_04520 [Armatimonadota bacterium]|nr:hypothetical protein [Armatimonadota bacterium]
MAGIREAGLHGDRSRIPEMVAALQRPQRPYMIKTALHGLAHLGAVEALPAIDALIRNDQADPDDRNYAIAARARLVAEYTSVPVADPGGRAAAKISRLQRETGLSAGRMNAAAHNYRANGRHSYDPEQPMEVYVMRDLADIAYRENYRSPNGVPGAEGVDFSQDPASALKVQLASLPKGQRVAWLVQDLAHAKGQSETESFEIELAADEGLPVSRAAALQLQEMVKHRDQYTFNGFANLSVLMRCIGDKSQLPFLQQLSASEPNPNLARGWRLSYSRVFYGKREFFENGY